MDYFISTWVCIAHCATRRATTGSHVVRKCNYYSFNQHQQSLVSWSLAHVCWFSKMRFSKLQGGGELKEILNHSGNMMLVMCFALVGGLKWLSQILPITNMQHPTDRHV